MKSDRRLFAALIASALLLTSAAHAAPRPIVAGQQIVLEFPSTAMQGATVGGAYVMQTNLQNPAGGHFRIYFEEISGDTTNFDVEIIGIGGVLSTISGADFLDPNNDGKYGSDSVVGSDIAVRVIAPQQPGNLKFKIARLAYEQIAGALLSVSGPDQRIKTASLGTNDPKRIHARSVAKLLFTGPDGGEYLCTGFMISADRLLTNHHCLGVRSTCASAIALFGYIDDATPVPPEQQVRCKRFLASDEDRDMAVVELAKPIGNTWGVLTLSTAPVKKFTKAYIPEHPSGRSQEISVVDCTIGDTPVNGNAAGMDAAHLCDTEGGASGSPVIDLATNQVIALHHLGFDDTGAFKALNRAVLIARVKEKIPQ